MWSKGNDDFTASRARHVTFPRVFPIGLAIGQWAFDTLSSLYTLANTTCSKSDCFVRPITVEMDLHKAR